MALAAAAWALDRSMHEDDGASARRADDEVRPMRLHLLPHASDDLARLLAKSAAHRGPPM
jgi:hypothetical protein